MGRRQRRAIARIVKTRGRPRARLLFSDERQRQRHVDVPGEAPTVGSLIEVQLRRTSKGAGWTVESWELRARHDEATAFLYDILGRLGIDPFYPMEVEREVAALLERPEIEDPTLHDLTGLDFVTIDNEDSRDLDQAIHIERRHDTERSGFVVRYALADASHYVRPGSALFDEALRRGVSSYLPGLVVPMLPPELSEGIISLNPGVDRRAFVFVMTLDDDGRCDTTAIRRARIRSRAKLTYDGVQAYHDDPLTCPFAGQPFCEVLDLMREVGERRLTLESGRDVIRFQRLNTSVDIDDQGRFVLVEDVRNDVSLWNEQISLMCNIQGAKFLAACPEPRPDVQPIYRVHEAPSSESLDHVVRVIEGIVQLHGLDREMWCWQRRGAAAVSLGDYLDRLPRGGATERIRRAIERQALVINHRSAYTSEPGRHFALGVTPYSRFSSPMREIVGIFTHKEALEKLRLITPTAAPEVDEELRERTIDAANAAKEQQRRLDKALIELAVGDLFRKDLDFELADRPVYKATILGIKATRLYVQLDDPPAEVKVYVPHIEAVLGRSLAMSADELELAPEDQLDDDPDDRTRFRIGDAVSLRCHGYDTARRRWDLRPVS